MWCLYPTRQCYDCKGKIGPIVVEERKLVVEEQGGFKKSRGCRDQILTLMLVGQVQMAMRKSGMRAAFIDLKKAYFIDESA